MEDEAILLRPWEPEDLVDAFRSEELGRYFGSAIDGKPLTEDEDMPTYAIVERNSQAVVGRIWCRSGARPPEVGYVLREDAWGQGYATRALALTTEWLLEAAGYPEVVLCTHPDNARSQRVAARCAFVEDRILDEYAQFKDGTRTAIRFVRRG